MQKKPSQSPGTMLTLFLQTYNLNPTSLARELQINQASVRLLTLDKARISARIAMRLGKFFNVKPQYWLDLQNAYELSVAAKDVKLAAELKKIPVAKKPAQAKQSAGKKSVGNKGRKRAAPKAGAQKTGRRGRPGKKES
jgi:addiction module HigA family antidote